MVTSTFSSNYAAVKVGKIKKINTDGTYDITFDDGDERKNTPLNECMTSQQFSDDIRLLKSTVFNQQLGKILKRSTVISFAHLCLRK